MAKILELPVLNHITATNEKTKKDWTSKDLQDYLEGPEKTLEELDKFFNDELILGVKKIRKSLGEAKFNNLEKLFSISEVDKKLLKVTKKEKLTTGIQLAHVVTTSMWGFTCAVAGFFAFSNLAVASFLLMIVLISSIPAIYLIKKSFNALWQQEQEIKAEFYLSELKFIVAERINKKLQDDIQDEKLSITENLKKLLPEDNDLNDQIKFDVIIKTLEFKYPYLKLERLKQLKTALDSSSASSRKIDNENLIVNNLINKEQNKPLRWKAFKKWMRDNLQAVLKTAVPSLLGTTAGSMVFPGVILLLGTAKLTTISFLGIGVVAAALTTPMGAGIAIAAAVTLGILVAGLAIYSQYKVASRAHRLKHANQNVEILRKEFSSLLIQKNKISLINSELKHIVEQVSKFEATNKYNAQSNNHVELLEKSSNGIHAEPAVFLENQNKALLQIVTPTSSSLSKDLQRRRSASFSKVPSNKYC